MDLASIFVNNLEENTTEADLRDYFKDCGTIVKVYMNIKQRSQQELINLQGQCILTYNFKIKIKLKMLYFFMKV